VVGGGRTGVRSRDSGSTSAAERLEGTGYMGKRVGRRCLRPTSDASLGIGRAGLQSRPARSQRVTALAAEATCSLMALAGARRREIDAK